MPPAPRPTMRAARSTNLCQVSEGEMGPACLGTVGGVLWLDCQRHLWGEAGKGLEHCAKDLRDPGELDFIVTI